MGILVACLGSSSTIGACSSARHVVANERSAVLACKGEKFITLGTLRNLDTILVCPLLDLAVGPRVEKSIAEALLGSGS